MQCRDEILLIHGDLAREQLMPKNFSFYNPEQHQLIIALLKENPRLPSSPPPGVTLSWLERCTHSPLIEDGDFDIPSVYITDMTVKDCFAQRAYLPPPQPR